MECEKAGKIESAVSTAVETSPLRSKSSGEPAVKTDWIIFSVFVALGCLQLAGWNAMLNILDDIGRAVAVKDLATVVRWCYGAVLFAITAFFVKFDYVIKSIMYAGLLLTSVIMLLFAVVLQWSPAATRYAYPILACGLAASAGMIGSTGFGFASHFPKDYSGAMSAGLGVSGLAMWAIWYLASQAIFTGGTLVALQKSMWLFSGAILLLTVGAAVVFNYLFSKPLIVAWFATQHERNASKNNDCEKNSQAVEDDYEIGGLSYILKKSWLMGIPTFLCLFITLIPFPIIGPVAWYPSSSQTILLFIGLYNLGDLIGRYCPNVIPKLMITPLYVHIVSYSRFFCILFFILSAVYKNNGFLASVIFRAFLMLALSLTNGWMSTVTFVRTIEQVNGDGAKKRIASFCLLCVTGSILVAQGIVYFITPLFL